MDGSIRRKECRRNKRYCELKTEPFSIADEKLLLEDQIIQKELRRKILKVLQTLPDPYRDVFILHAIGEVKLKEIAYIYGKSESWARVTYFRAKQQISTEVSK